MFHDRLIIFVKAPRVGFVKTRLGEQIGMKEACSAYRRMVDALLRKLQNLSCEVELCYSPEDAVDEIRAWKANRWEFHPQGGGNLGSRLAAAFGRAFSAGADRVCIIGSDCPYLEAADINAAFSLLEKADVVLGPAEDGGYWLIGLKKLRLELLSDIEWSSAGVLKQTVAKVDALQLRAEFLRQLPDIDTAEDWSRYLLSEPSANAS